jgi:hypothetical protein
MDEYPTDETLEKIIRLFHEDTALFVIIECLWENDDMNISELLEAEK